ncbi:SWI2/SNF2-containing protein [Cardiosporidium cionae]|uniref:SWI2/SNF2-containing protein n=1 Tax=Cardiosporidium cionae TaxID=476202 RepID=A0ABQ7J568_9APIC|nr:SWI2/SNF2-containing protein [Cardiosporidium cionae]|eukprot:KAF8819151.1 SWI2/SNF2-containing protein [Cardiosporidium cionae]
MIPNMTTRFFDFRNYAYRGKSDFDKLPSIPKKREWTKSNSSGEALENSPPSATVRCATGATNRPSSTPSMKVPSLKEVKKDGSSPKNVILASSTSSSSTFTRLVRENSISSNKLCGKFYPQDAVKQKSVPTLKKAEYPMMPAKISTSTDPFSSVDDPKLKGMTASPAAEIQASTLHASGIRTASSTAMPSFPFSNQRKRVAESPSFGENGSSTVKNNFRNANSSCTSTDKTERKATEDDFKSFLDILTASPLPSPVVAVKNACEEPAHIEIQKPVNSYEGEKRIKDGSRKRLRKCRVVHSDDEDSPLFSPIISYAAHKSSLGSPALDFPEETFSGPEYQSSEDEAAFFELQDCFDVSEVMSEKIVSTLGGQDSHSLSILRNSISNGRCNAHRSYNLPMDLHENSCQTDCRLKEYQKCGVHWLLTLHNADRNGILADEMGLGKTAQTLVFLNYLYYSGKITAPTIIATPASLLDNWLKEINAWAPILKDRVMKYQGKQSERREMVLEFLRQMGENCRYYILLTSINTLTSKWDIQYLKRIWPVAYLVVDEAHSLKNNNSLIYRKLDRKISCERRLLLTGSPVQNRTVELRNLLLFVMPHIFKEHSLDSALQFYAKQLSREKSIDKTSTAVPAGSLGSTACVQQMDVKESEKTPLKEKETVLHKVLNLIQCKNDTLSPEVQCLQKILAPFILRRLKSEVLDDLPKKKSVVIRCRMEGRQAALYIAELSQKKSKFVTSLPKFTTLLQGHSVGNKKEGTLVRSRKEKVSLDPPDKSQAVVVEEVASIVLSVKEEDSKDKTSQPWLLMERTISTESVKGHGGQGVSKVERTEKRCIKAEENPDNTKKLPAQSHTLDTDRERSEVYSPCNQSGSDYEEGSSKERGGEGGPLKPSAEKNGSNGGPFVNSLICRLRRICNHPLLMQGFFSEEIIQVTTYEIIDHFHLRVEGFMGNPRKRVEDEIRKWSDYEIHQGIKLLISNGDRRLEKFLISKENLKESAKMRRMLEIVRNVHKNSEKALIFSHYTTHLDIIQESLDEFCPEINHCRLDGTTNVAIRQSTVDTFNTASNITLFLLSTKAGGQGLNLSSARTVILMDQDWNPHNDRQAEDRVHRIGQTKDVTIYRLCCRATVEESILNCCQKKLDLDEAFGGNAELLMSAILNDSLSFFQDDSMGKIDGEGADISEYQA